MESNENRPEQTVINIHDGLEVQYWSNIFGVSPAALKKAAAATGSSCLKMIELYLTTNKLEMHDNT